MLEKCISALTQFRDLPKRQKYDRWSCHLIAGKLSEEEVLSATWPDFERLTPEEWIQVRATVDADLAFLMLTYPMRMATFALREKDSARIADGCMGMILDPDLVDPRDLLDTAVLVFDAADRINAPLHKILPRARTFATPARSALLESMDLQFGTYFGLGSSGYACISADEGSTYKKVSVEATGKSLAEILSGTSIRVKP